MSRFSRKVMWYWLKMAYLWALWGRLDTQFFMHWNVSAAWQKEHAAYSLCHIFLSLIGQLVHPSPQIKWGGQTLSLGELTCTEAVWSDRYPLCPFHTNSLNKSNTFDWVHLIANLKFAISTFSVTFILTVLLSVSAFYWNVKVSKGKRISLLVSMMFGEELRSMRKIKSQGTCWGLLLLWATCHQ